MNPLPRLVEIRTDDRAVPGDLTVSRGSRGLVIFAHGSDRNRLNPRDRFVARELNREGFATLLVDLVMTGTAADAPGDIALVAQRLSAVTDWVTNTPETRGLHIGYFGVDVGAAAALVVAARRPAIVDAVVSRGVPRDLVTDSLDLVLAPTRLIVGGDDLEGLDLSELVRARLSYADVAVIPGVGDPCEGRNALARVAELTGEWFTRYLTPLIRSSGSRRGQVVSISHAP